MNAVVSNSTTVQTADQSHFNTQVSSVNTWHARLGHTPAHVIHLLPVKSHNKVLDTCDSCSFVKQSRLSF